MKTLITAFLILISSLTSSLFSQVTTNKEYLKATNILWSSCHDFRIIKDSENQDKDRNELLPTLKRNIENAKKEYILLSKNFANNPDVKKLDTWIKTLEKCYESLNSDSWESNPVWQLGYTLVELDLNDYVNQKL